MTKQIMITFQQILDHSPCIEGWAKLLLAKGIIDQETHDEWVDVEDYSDVELPTEPFPLSDILETNDVQDTIWALRCIDNKELIAEIAISLVHQVEDLMTDERSKRVLRVAWNYLTATATREELEKAYAAAGDAVNAYVTAAARAAARAAAGAAGATAAAVYTAAVYAAAARATRDADNEIEEKQRQLLKEILDSGAVKCPWENENDN